ncbi:hypothetical protein HanIR_Chr04g0181751 [Helianthus annuus]|nr:hypothetical protein HanIR_Chr04g0181751 [Helianthus annuus]
MSALCEMHAIFSHHVNASHQLLRCALISASGASRIMRALCAHFKTKLINMSVMQHISIYCTLSI